MKETLERVYHICKILNNKFDGNLIEQEKLEDFINSVREDWDTSYGQLKEGIQIIESELASIDSSKNSEYTQGILDIFWGFRHLEVLIGDADELLVALHKKFMYKSGEITLEEYLDDGVIELEDADDEDDL